MNEILWDKVTEVSILGVFYSSPLKKFEKPDWTSKDLKHGSQDLLHGKNVEIRF